MEKSVEKPKKKVFRWEVTQFVSSTSMLAVKVVFDPNEPKMSKRFGILFQIKNKKQDEERWVEAQSLFRANEIAKVVEFLEMKEPVEKSTYYYRLDDENDRRQLQFLFGKSKLIESLINDKRNFPVALVFQHRYTTKDGETKTKAIMFLKGIETKKEKHRGYLRGEYVKIVVKNGDGIFLKKLSDLEVENFKLQLEAIVQMTTTVPVIYKLDYLIKLATTTDTEEVEESETIEEEEPEEAYAEE